jgi:hypothetical protein
MNQSKVADVMFSFNETMQLFASGNVVVMVRNAGRHVIPVGRVAERVSRFIKGK